MYTSSLNFHFLQLQVSKIMSTDKFYLSLPEELSLLVFWFTLLWLSNERKKVLRVTSVNRALEIHVCNGPSNKCTICPHYIHCSPICNRSSSNHSYDLATWNSENNKENASPNKSPKNRKKRSFPFNFLQFEFCHLMARYSFVSRLSGYNWNITNSRHLTPETQETSRRESNKIFFFEKI